MATDASCRAVGLINQRYNISLIGNHQKIEVVSNYDRFKHSVPFHNKTKTWYRLKTQVDVHQDGTGTIRAKAWRRGEDEPADWTIEAKHDTVHIKTALRTFRLLSAKSEAGLHRQPKGNP